VINWAELGVAGKAGASKAQIDAVERRLGVELPAGYKDLVAYADEATFEIAEFEYGEMGDATGISEFLACSVEETDYSIGFYVRKQEAPVTMVPVARDARDLEICLSYEGAEDRNPKVVLRDPFDEVSYYVAENFEEFIGKLHA